MTQPASLASPVLPYRIGHGYDVHRLVPGRPCILGGVEIPHSHGLEGHSDADCLTHALADALLGSLALPDIGHAFPPSEPRWKGMDSQEILRFAAEAVRARGYEIGNVDISVIAEAPKLAPHLDAMRAVLSRTLGIVPDCIGLKATTHERLGAFGRGEGICAHAVCLVYRLEAS